MSDLKLYEVACSVSFYVDVEAIDEDEAKIIAEEHLVNKGVYDLVVSTSPIVIDSIRKLKRFFL